MNPNNYLICKPAGKHAIEIGSQIYTVLFDQYNSLGFDWKIVPYPRMPHYFQEVDMINNFKERLNQTLRGQFENFLFDTSGSMAIEHAIHYAQLYTGKEGALKFRGCYHGSTLAIKELNKDPLSLPHDTEDALVGVDPFSYEQSLTEIKDRLSTAKYACIIIDPNFCDYLISVPEWYWKRLREICNQLHVLIILDEMRTGFRSEKIWFANELPISVDLIIGAKALSNGLPFSLTGIHNSIYNEDCFHKVDKYCTGFSYNPLIFTNLLSIFDQLHRFYNEEDVGLRAMLKEVALEYATDFLSIKPRGVGMVLTLKMPKPTLSAALCEAKLKKEGILLYRAENKYIIYPHFNFSFERLKPVLIRLINIICNYYESKKETFSYRST